MSRNRAGRFSVTHFTGFGAFTFLFYVYLFIPIVALVVFSFNSSSSATIWTGFSTKWFVVAFTNRDLQNSAINSFTIALSAAILSTIASTLLAIMAAREAARRPSGLAQGLIMLPLVIPEIVVGVASLGFFSLVGLQLGRGNLIIAHTVLCIPYAFLPVRARLQNMDGSLELAARDLYATELRVLRYITVPLLAPGIIAGLMLAFVNSMDNFIVSMLVAQPGSTTLPIYIYALMRQGVRPDVNAASTIILAISVVLVVLSYLIARRAERPVKSE